MLSEPRYLVVIVETDYNKKGMLSKLDELSWKSFQLRIIPKEIECPEITYNKNNNGVFDDEIYVIKRDTDENKVIYNCKYSPLTVELIPTKKISVTTYPEKSTLESAMDTFQCVMYFS